MLYEVIASIKKTQPRCAGKRSGMTGMKTLANPPTIEERVGINEQARKDCQKNYDGRLDTLDERMGKMEALKDKFFWLLMLAVLGIVGQLVLAAMGLKK
jgi:hypothetical protein